MAERSSLVPPALIPEDTAGQLSDTGHQPGNAGESQAGESQVEITAIYNDDTLVFIVSGKWQEKGGGRLEAELQGLAAAANWADQLPATGSAALHVQRLLGVPIQVRRIELDLKFGDSHLWVRHNLRLGIQLLGLDVPGILIVSAADGAHYEEVDVRINPSQIVAMAKDITFIRPGPPDSH